MSESRKAKSFPPLIADTPGKIKGLLVKSRAIVLYVLFTC